MWPNLAVSSLGGTLSGPRRDARSCGANVSKRKAALLQICRSSVFNVHVGRHFYAASCSQTGLDGMPHTAVMWSAFTFSGSGSATQLQLCIGEAQLKAPVGEKYPNVVARRSSKVSFAGSAEEQPALTCWFCSWASTENTCCQLNGPSRMSGWSHKRKAVSE